MNENEEKKQNVDVEREETTDVWDRAVQIAEMATSVCLILSMIFCGAAAYRFVKFYPEATRLEIRVAPTETNGETTNESGAANDAQNDAADER